MTKNDGNDAILKHTPPFVTRKNGEMTVKKWISLDISEACGDSGAMSKSAELQNPEEKVTAQYLLSPVMVLAAGSRSAPRCPEATRLRPGRPSANFTASDLESILSGILLETAKAIQHGGRWIVTPEVRAAEIDVDRVFHAVVSRAMSIDDFRAACRRWKDAGTRETG